jgi:hypothetical protein
MRFRLIVAFSVKQRRLGSFSLPARARSGLKNAEYHLFGLQGQITAGTAGVHAGVFIEIVDGVVRDVGLRESRRRVIEVK